MSLHGTQLRLSFGFDEKDKTDFSFDVALAVNFIQLLKRANEDENEILSNYSVIGWPFLFIQSEPNYHTMIDDVGVFNFNMKITNAPRTAQVGHVLRDATLPQLEKLEIAKKVIQFQHKIQLENENSDSGLEDEFVSHEIKGLVDPKILQGFAQIVSKPIEFQMADFACLESLFTFDDAINFAHKYIKCIDEAKGNAFRWETLRNLVNEPLEKWRTDLAVQIKDLKDRFKAQVQKANEIDETQISSRLDSTKDNLDQWVLREQKNLIGKIGGLFVQIDLIMEDLRRKNKFFLETETLKTRKIGEVVQKAFQHIAHIRSTLTESDTILNDISLKMNSLRQEVENIEYNSGERFKQVNAELIDKKQAQDSKIVQIQQEFETEIDKIQTLLDAIDKYWYEIQNIIREKSDSCLYDQKCLREWQLDDKINKIANPTIRYFVPVGIGLFTNEDEDERIEVIFPSVYNGDLKRIPLSPEFFKFEKDLEKKLDKDMKSRSNFEYTLGKKSIKNTTTMMQMLKRGLDWLETKKMIEQSEKQEYLKILDKMSAI